MKAKIVATIASAILWLLAGAAYAMDPVAARKAELAKALSALANPGIETEERQEDPGWYNPTNREALRVFIRKYPATEEAYQAEVWLVFAQANTETGSNPSERRSLRAERARRLEQIAGLTATPGTRKMAKLSRVCELFSAEDFAGFRKQTSDILSHVEDYRSERDPQYLDFVKVFGMAGAELEPSLRSMVIVVECYEDHLERALNQALDLKRRFPEWSQRENMDAAIAQLKRGVSPYPKRPPPL